MNKLFLSACLGLGKIDRTYHIAAQDINPSTGKAYAVRPDGVWDDNYFAQNFGGGSGGGGGNPAAYDDLLKNTPKALDFANTLDASENNAFADYLGYMKSQDSPLDFYTKISEASGIPGMRKTQKSLQGQIYDMEDALRRVEPDVSATSRNSIVTEAQRRGMVQERQKPLLENLGWYGQSLGRVSSAIADEQKNALTLTDLQGQGVNRISDVYKTKLQLTADQNARKMTGFTADKETFLNVSLAKIKRGEEISDMEKQQAFELLKMEKQYKLEYDNEMKLYENKPDTEIVTVGGRKVLVNKRTGAKISDLGSSSEGGTGVGVAGAANYYGDTSTSSSGNDSDWEVVPNFRNVIDYNNWLSKQ